MNYNILMNYTCSKEEISALKKYVPSSFHQYMTGKCKIADEKKQPGLGAYLGFDVRQIVYEFHSGNGETKIFPALINRNNESGLTQIGVIFYY